MGNDPKILTQRPDSRNGKMCSVFQESACVWFALTHGQEEEKERRGESQKDSSISDSAVKTENEDQGDGALMKCQGLGAQWLEPKLHDLHRGNYLEKR